MERLTPSLTKYWAAEASERTIRGQIKSALTATKEQHFQDSITNYEASSNTVTITLPNNLFQNKNPHPLANGSSLRLVTWWDALFSQQQLKGFNFFPSFRPSVLKMHLLL